MANRIRIELLEMIAKDMKDDATHYESQAFNERNVIEYFGKQGAAIAALAEMLQSILEEAHPPKEKSDA